MRARQFLEAEKHNKWNMHMATFFLKDTDIIPMRKTWTEAFGETFRMGYHNYAQGEWMVAERFLSTTLELRGVHDGPSAALLRFMKTHNFQAPKDWKGVHQIGEG